MPDQMPVHAQPTAERKPWRGRSSGADLCRRDPARWSAMVRYQDQLEREGWSRVHADQIAWAYFVGTRPPVPGIGDGQPELAEGSWVPVTDVYPA